MREGKTREERLRLECRGQASSLFDSFCFLHYFFFFFSNLLPLKTQSSESLADLLAGGEMGRKKKKKSSNGKTDVATVWDTALGCTFFFFAADFMAAVE